MRNFFHLKYFVKATSTTTLGLLGAIGLLVSVSTTAQETEIIEEIVTIGTRIQGRSVTDSAVPIDLVTGDEFQNQGDTDLNSLLRNIVPSYNVNTQPISDAATLQRPANLRGLAPDHTLVLLNGKRRHRGAVITWLGNGVADGAQGPDISIIPAIALRQVEVLRDGAAAQYGSDAIAGVMNFELKDAAEGGNLEVKMGEYYEGDGQQVTIAGNVGMPFTELGFANFSFEYGNYDETDRSIQRNDAAALIANGNTAVNNPAQKWGQPEIEDDLKLIANVGLELGGGKDFYMFGNYAQKHIDGGFFFRNPDTRGAVFATTLANPNYVGGNPLPGFEDEPASVSVRLVGDLSGSGACGFTPAVTSTQGNPFTFNGSIPGESDAANPNRDQLSAIMADSNCFVFNGMFPGGFTPRFGGDLNDIGGVMGVRGETDGGLYWDVSGGIGRNEADFFIYNTVNASLGPNTPTSFDPGKYIQLEKNFNIDLAYPIAVDFFASDLNIAAGFEFREEQFEIVVGDQESFEIGPLADQGFSAASNGFPGFSNLAGGQWDRSNVAAYLDFEADITDIWLMGVAFRFEDFEDFGNTFNYKLATNVGLTDTISLRASYSTGFRAPTPGQSNAFNVSTEFDPVLNDLVNNGTIPPTNPVAQLRGGQALDAEESTNASVGLVMSFGPVDITADYFQIELEDRLAVSQDFSLTQAEIDALLASGVTSAANLQNFRFFTNGLDTTTKGFDIVATYSTDIVGENTDLSLAYNNTDTEVDAFSAITIDQTRIRELQEGLPQTRWNIRAVTNWGLFDTAVRISYFDDFYDSEDDQTYGNEIIVDAEVSYYATENISITLGAQNLFDEFPDENPEGADEAGRRYSQFSPSGFGGGFYYLRGRYNF